jgi:hypothetical protein
VHGDQEVLDAGVYTSVSEVAEAEGIGKPYVLPIWMLAIEQEHG